MRVKVRDESTLYDTDLKTIYNGQLRRNKIYEVTALHLANRRNGMNGVSYELDGLNGIFSSQEFIVVDCDNQKDLKIKFSSLRDPKERLADLLHNEKEGDLPRMNPFYGHYQKGKDIDNSCLSQWFPSKFIINEKAYNCMEQYMMSAKARLFNDLATDEEIMKANHPKICKSLGRKVKNFNQKEWDEAKYKIVIEGNLRKFLADEKLVYFLLGTCAMVLIEASPYDKIWGVGLSKEHPLIHRPSQWLGQNLLGFALMEVREYLREIFRWNI